MNMKNCRKHNEQGFVLILSLILLLIITVASVTNMKTNVVERKMGADAQDQLLAKQSAESAIQGAKTWLSQQCFKPATCACPSTTCSVCTQGSAPPTLTSANAKTYVNAMPLTAAAPVYVIEESYWDAAHGDQYYKITATGYGRSNTTTATLQATYVKHTPFVGYNGAPPGNLFRLRSVSNNAYRIPYPCWTYISASTSAGIDDTVWWMCTRDDGKTAFREHASKTSGFSCRSQRYFMGLDTNPNQKIVGTNNPMFSGIPGYTASGVPSPYSNVVHMGAFLASSNPDFSTLPTIATTWFNFIYLYTDNDNTATKTVSGSTQTVSEPTVPKTVFLWQASNGNFVRAATPSGVYGAPDFTLTADTPGIPSSNQYHFKIEIIGTAPPQYPSLP